MSRASIAIAGRLGRDPELREYGNAGKTFARASLAVDLSKAPRQGERREEVTQWFDIVAFGRQADELAQTQKGAFVAVAGELEGRDYNDKRYFTVVASSVIAAEPMMRTGAQSGTHGADRNPARQGGEQQPPADDDFDTDIPF